MRSRTWLLAVVSLGAIVVALGLAGPAGAAVQCGDSITRDVTLHRDLDCSGGDGLEVARDNLTIDLNGKQLIGTGDYAIDANEHAGIVVKNGTLRRWLNGGVYGYGASRLRLANLTIRLAGSNIGYGFQSQYASDVTIRKVIVDNAECGFSFYKVGGVEMTDSKVIGSDPTRTYGLEMAISDGLIDNLTANGAMWGAYLSGESSGVRLVDSTFDDAGQLGVEVQNSTPASNYLYTLIRNTARRAGSFGFYASEPVRGRENRATGAGGANCVNVPCRGG